jgi:hypothetical protein
MTNCEWNDFIREPTEIFNDKVRCIFVTRLYGFKSFCPMKLRGKIIFCFSSNNKWNIPHTCFI